jgi:lipoprotein-releasing system permease protein
VAVGVRTDLFLAWRFLRDSRAQSVLLVAGATVGVSVVFFITALIDAVQTTMVAQTLDVLPHIVIRRPDETLRDSAGEGSVISMPTVFKPAQRLRSLENWPELVTELERVPQVVAVSPTATGPAMATRATATRAITLMGVDAVRFPEVISIRPRMRSGALSLDGNQAVIGNELANDFGVRIGDRIQVAVEGKTSTSFHVSGIFDLGNRDVNRRWVLVSLRHGQTLLDLPGGVSTLDLRTDDIWAAENIARMLQQRTKLKVDSWMATNSQLMVGLRSQAGSRDMIRILVIVAVAMGIASVLVVSVVQRSRQIGILRAMGMAKTTVLRVFLWQGAAIGLLGAVFGTALGSLFAWLFQGSASNSDGTPTYPVDFSMTLFVGAGLVAVLTGVLAAILPASRAARLDPATAIRHE